MAEASTTDKGKLLEDLVAMLHEDPGVTVQQRVKLPTRYNPKSRREIDILVTGSVAGHRVQLAIECKNLKGPVTTEQIGDFAAKLHQIGLAPSQGLFVTTSRFTGDALDHAQSLNMTTLIFPDLTENGLNLAVSEALQRSYGFPHIFFHTGPQGREARVRGTGLTVWELVQLTREFDGDIVAAAAHLEIDSMLLEEAVKFADCYPREIEKAIHDSESFTLERLKETLPGLEIFDAASEQE